MKSLILSLPDEINIPEIITSFSPKENYLMLKIGSNSLLEGRKAIIGFTQKEIYEKIKNESKEEIQELEMSILVEKEMTKKMEQTIKIFYENQIDHFTKNI